MLAQRIGTMNAWASKTNVSSAELANGKFERLIENLNLSHGISYRKFIVGLDSIIDTYLEADASHGGNPNELLAKALELRDQVTRKVPAIKRYWENGFNMS